MDEIERAAPNRRPHRLAGPDLGDPRRGRSVRGGAVGIVVDPVLLRGPQPELGMASLRDFSLNGADSATDRAQWRTALTSLYSDAPTGLAASATGTLAALDTAAALNEGDLAAHNGAEYPDSSLGGALHDAARLIRADIGVRVITIDEGDWDMHADLGRTDNGWMHDKLTDLGGSLAAFATDLGTALDHVTLVTMSEFGRRVEENRVGRGGPRLGQLHVRAGRSRRDRCPRHLADAGRRPADRRRSDGDHGLSGRPGRCPGQPHRRHGSADPDRVPQLPGQTLGRDHRRVNLVDAGPWLVPLRRGGVGIDPAALGVESPPCGRRGVDQCSASLALGCARLFRLTPPDSTPPHPGSVSLCAQPRGGRPGPAG